MPPVERKAEGRVVSVRPSGGRYGVLLGPGPHFTWFEAEHPPKLGARVEVVGGVTTDERSIEGGKAYTAVLQDAHFVVDPDPWSRREVAGVWRERVRLASQRSLYDFQTEGAGWLASRLAMRKGSILADDPGLGKTTQSIAAVLATPDALPCLVVAPATLRENWEREIIATARIDWDLPVVIMSAGVPMPARGTAAFVVTNYEQLAAREQQISAHAFHSVILDEAHAVKNPTASGNHRAAVVTRLIWHIRRVLLLTGSPVLNRPNELWRLLYLTDPEAWGSLEAFRDRYCTVRRDERPDVETASGTLKNLEELHIRTAPCLLRRLKKHVLHELPEKKRRTLRVPMSARDAANYAAAEQDVIKWLQQVGIEQANVGKKQHAALQKLTTLRRIAALAKVRTALPSYLAAWTARVGRPLVIFGYHKDVVAGALSVARRLGASALQLTADLNLKERQAAVDAFARGEFMFLCCSLLVAGIGVNLQGACSDILFLERLFQPPMMAQAEDRVHRIGQRNAVTCTYMDAENTIDQHIARILASKRLLIDHTIGDAELAAWQIARGMAF